MKKLILILALFLSNAVFAATPTYSSGVVPLNGQYNLEISNICAVDDASPIVPSKSVINEALIGNLIFTPDTTQTSKVSSIDAYNKWIAYVTPLTASSPSPAVAPPVLSQVIDPTNPALKLIETPLQWGTMKQITIESDITYPITSIPSSYNYYENAFAVITKYTYSNSALNGGIATGYAIYRQKSGNPWKRIQAFPNTFTTSPTLSASTNFLVMTQYTDQIMSGSQPVTFNCRSRVNLVR